MISYVSQNIMDFSLYSTALIRSIYQYLIIAKPLVEVFEKCYKVQSNQRNNPISFYEIIRMRVPDFKLIPQLVLQEKQLSFLNSNSSAIIIDLAIRVFTFFQIKIIDVVHTLSVQYEYSDC